MAAVDWQEVVDACDQALLDIATTQRPVSISYAGRTVQLFSTDQALSLKTHAEQMLERESNSGDPVSFAEFGDFI